MSNNGYFCKYYVYPAGRGVFRQAYCPNGNTDPNGLMWSRPPCTLDTCDEPGTVPAGYRRRWVKDFSTCGAKAMGIPPGSVRKATRASLRRRGSISQL